eukprot:GHUV01000662.1.p1 GENE.GHUV01000662.1~~GHUV01000662.1.p1  ORF type:complete len:451 (+),score=183.33 GHUV01000662.1:443-1795(+)
MSVELCILALLQVQTVQPLSASNFAQLAEHHALLLKLAAMGYADLQPTLDAITQWPQGNISAAAVGPPGLQQLMQVYLNQQQPQLPATSTPYNPNPAASAALLTNPALFGLTQQQPGSPSYSSNSSTSGFTAPGSPNPYSSGLSPSAYLQQQQAEQQWLLNNAAATLPGNYTGLPGPDAVQSNLQQLLQLSAGLPAASAALACSPSNLTSHMQYSQQMSAGLASLAALTSQTSNASSLASSISSMGPLRQASLGSNSWCSSPTNNFLDLNNMAAAAGDEVVVCSSFCKQEISLALNAAVTALLQTMRSLQYSGENPYPRQNRRFVCGLRESCKALKAGKVKAVLLAPDIQLNRSDRPELRSEVLDNRVNDILKGCCKPGEPGVPVVFALGRKQIGQVFGTKKRMSAVAVLDVSGVDDLFEMVLQLAVEGRVAWEAKALKVNTHNPCTLDP